LHSNCSAGNFWGPDCTTAQLENWEKLKMTMVLPRIEIFNGISFTSLFRCFTFSTDTIRKRGPPSAASQGGFGVLIFRMAEDSLADSTLLNL
jgi:hypothetical protein